MRAGHCYEFSSAATASSALWKLTGLCHPEVPQQSHLGTSPDSSVGASIPLCICTFDICAYIYSFSTLCMQEQIHKGRNIHLIQHLLGTTHTCSRVQHGKLILAPQLYLSGLAGEAGVPKLWQQGDLSLLVLYATHFYQFLSLIFKNNVPTF